MLNTLGDAAVLVDPLPSSPTQAWLGSVPSLLLADGSRAQIDLDPEVGRAAVANGRILVIQTRGDRVIAEAWIPAWSEG